MHQGIRIWYKCYHSTKYPVTTFMHLDDIDESLEEPEKLSNLQDPIANSTLIDALGNSQQTQEQRIIAESLATNSAVINSSVHFNDSPTNNSHSVGHTSHIPRTPPSPATYSIPSIINKAIGTDLENEHIFGMIKLKENDVCYTSGTIEWVGRKRSFPINSGFKIINESFKQVIEPVSKRIKKISQGEGEKLRECYCTDVLPTVNAIVDHLNALHEAVDLVDLRLNTLEEATSKDQ